MYSKGAMSGTDLIALLVVVVLVMGFFYMVAQPRVNPQSPVNPSTTVSSSAVPAPSGGGGTGPNYATATYTANTIDALTGAVPNVNDEIWQSNPSGDIQKIAVGNCSTAACSISTSAPTVLSGYAMIGNDLRLASTIAAWTDRSTQYYLRKIPISYNAASQGGVFTLSDPLTGGPVQLVQGGNPTINGYNNGATASPINVTINTGQTIDTAEFQLIAASNTCFGNPDFDGQGPIGVTFNASNSSVKSKWADARPLSFLSSQTAPLNQTTDTNVINGLLYVLPTNAVCDGRLSASFNGQSHPSNFRFGIRLQAASGQRLLTAGDANVGDGLSICFWDKTYYKSDFGQWNSGYEKPRINAQPQDIGQDSRSTNCAKISVTSTS